MHLNVKTVFSREVATAGTNVHTTSGEKHDQSHKKREQTMTKPEVQCSNILKAKVCVKGVCA